MDGKSKAQLDLLEEILSACRIMHIDIWLAGGWGLDFLIGKQSRTHDDLDFFVHRNNHADIIEIIKSIGCSVTLAKPEKVKFRKEDGECDITFIFDVNGKYYVDSDENDPLIYPLPDDSFPDEPVSCLYGIHAKVISAAAHYVSKAGYFQYAGKPLREKDKSDLRLITERVYSRRKELDLLLPGVGKNDFCYHTLSKEKNRSKKELWDIYDKNGNKTGRTHCRGKKLAPGYFHMIVENWIRNSEGEYLIQKRNKPIRNHINPWSTTAGAAVKGESGIRAVTRETREEIGLLFSEPEIHFRERCFFDDFFMDVYETEWNGKAGEIVYDPAEVAAVKWVTGSELKEMIIAGEFYSHPTVYLKRIAEGQS